MSKKSARFNQQRQASCCNSLLQQQQFSGKIISAKSKKSYWMEDFYNNRFWEANQLTDKVGN
jgi:hypothetical protein